MISSKVREAQFGRSPAFGGVTCLLGRHFETRIPMHVHSMYVLGVVDAGEVEVTVRGDVFVARPGSVISLQPFEAHAESAAPGRGWSFRYLYLTEAQVRLALGSDAVPGPVALRLNAPVVENDALALAIAFAHDRMRENRPVHDVERLLRALLLLARRYHCMESESSSGASRSRAGVQRARRLVVEKGLRRVTIAELSAVAGVSACHFSRTFHEEVGLPPYAYFDQVRIARAHDMIWGGQRVSTVAYALGYADQAHLTRHFRRASFMTPGQFAMIARGLPVR